uniref:Uncharacterized protein n=1 Tax=Brassica campestris TaxID=3711 RepID=A0A3P6ALX6_BRACM|nr:unnamed protein product [Brassica rapa]
MEVCNTTHVEEVCDTKVEARDTTHIPMESRFSKAEDEPEINQLGVGEGRHPSQSSRRARWRM